jgi:hypothetical protein
MVESGPFVITDGNYRSLSDLSDEFEQNSPPRAMTFRARVYRDWSLIHLAFSAACFCGSLPWKSVSRRLIVYF